MIVLFDIDGVLIKAFRFGPWFKDTYELTEEEMSSFWLNDFVECCTGHSDLRKVMQINLSRWGILDNVDTILKQWFKMDGDTIKTGLQLLEECKSKYEIIGTASTQESYRKDYILNNYDFINRMDLHFFSCDIGVTKQEIDFYRRINTILDEQDILYFDDSEQNVDNAKLAGWNAFHYTGQQSLTEFNI